MGWVETFAGKKSHPGWNYGTVIDVVVVEERELPGSYTQVLKKCARRYLRRCEGINGKWACWPVHKATLANRSFKGVTRFPCIDNYAWWELRLAVVNRRGREPFVFGV